MSRSLDTRGHMMMSTSTPQGAIDGSIQGEGIHPTDFRRLSRLRADAEMALGQAPHHRKSS